ILTRTPPPISTLFPYTTLFRSYENIVVTDLNSGLSAESDVPFLLSFGGAHGIIAGNLEGQIDFQSESGLYDICMCDFDNDGRNDIATANNNASQINLFANTTALPGVGNITFHRLSFLLGALSIHARCGDLDGDGKIVSAECWECV